MSTAWTEHIVVREGVRLSCRDWGGSGDPVLLLHGLAGHAGDWDALARELRRSHRVVAFDQRGHGASERHPGDVHLEHPEALGRLVQEYVRGLGRHP